MTDWSRQSSASEGGGMDALIKAARKEGGINLPAGPSSWPGYEALVKGFEAKFGLQAHYVTSGDDAEQLAAASDRSRQSGGVPDVFNLSVDTAAAKTAMFAAYLVFYWLEIPSSLKGRKAYWYDSCGGLMAIGYDSTSVPAVTSVTDLLRPAYAGAVTLDGDPRRERGALDAVMMASLAAGGSADNAGPGVDLFEQLRARGNLRAAGDHGLGSVIIDWDYVQREVTTGVAGWKYFVPTGAAVSGYDTQAINRAAAHPAAARLWEEYLFSDTGQNLCLLRGARPARLDAMKADGVINVAASYALGPAPAHVALLTAGQVAAARAYITTHWGA